MEQTPAPRLALTDDTLFDGRLICRQPENGYRFSVDAVLAAHFSTRKPGQRVLDLGCGCGVIGLILAHCCSGIEVTCLEIQDDLAALATENGRRNRFGGRFRVLRADVRNIAEALPPESFDLIVCNPPYRGRATGRLNRDGQAAHARHELHGDLLDFIRGAAFAVKNRGRVIVVYPARRSATLLATLQAQRLTPKRLQPVYSYPEAEQACLVLVEARKNGGEQVEILAPFFLYNEKNGGYTSAMQAIYQEAPCSPR